MSEPPKLLPEEYVGQFAQEYREDYSDARKTARRSGLPINRQQQLELPYQYLQKFNLEGKPVDLCHLHERDVGMITKYVPNIDTSKKTANAFITHRYFDTKIGRVCNELSKQRLLANYSLDSEERWFEETPHKVEEVEAYRVGVVWNPGRTGSTFGDLNQLRHQFRHLMSAPSSSGNGNLKSLNTKACASPNEECTCSRFMNELKSLLDISSSDSSLMSTPVKASGTPSETADTKMDTSAVVKKETKSEKIVANESIPTPSLPTSSSSSSSSSSVIPGATGAGKTTQIDPNAQNHSDLASVVNRMFGETVATLTKSTADSAAAAANAANAAANANNNNNKQQTDWITKEQQLQKEIQELRSKLPSSTTIPTPIPPTDAPKVQTEHAKLTADFIASYLKEFGHKQVSNEDMAKQLLEAAKTNPKLREILSSPSSSTETTTTTAKMDEKSDGSDSDGDEESFKQRRHSHHKSSKSKHKTGGKSKGSSSSSSSSSSMNAEYEEFLKFKEQRSKEQKVQSVPASSAALDDAMKDKKSKRTRASNEETEEDDMDEKEYEAKLRAAVNEYKQNKKQNQKSLKVKASNEGEDGDKKQETGYSRQDPSKIVFDVSADNQVWLDIPAHPMNIYARRQKNPVTGVEDGPRVIPMHAGTYCIMNGAQQALPANKWNHFDQPLKQPSLTVVSSSSSSSSSFNANGITGVVPVRAF